ncbi:MAG: ABC transporter permease [Thermoplasmata archaeon]|nr:MAG: ABC transporter permease [Thermoplasmata archaeon]RLF72211.1 MAG: ABC transporter permease [Thermoplasmata archaeon]RLF73418.1 MAG: ABC transporter permease [Thermoplasmata archaeon]HDD59503.1 ABC transporter permease subunit [Euryarchaeota archaeon]
MGNTSLRSPRTQDLWVEGALLVFGVLLALPFPLLGLLLLLLTTALLARGRVRATIFALEILTVSIFLLYPLTLFHVLSLVLPLLSYYHKAREEYEGFEAAMLLLSLLLLLLLSLPLLYVLAHYSPLPALHDEALLKSIAFTSAAAGTAALLGVLLSIPLSYILARRDFPGKGILEALVDLPIVIPHTVAGIMLLLLFSRYGPVGAAAEDLGISFYQTFLGTLVAMLFISAPFIVNQIREGIEKVPVRQEMVARSLGAPPWAAFRDVILPQVKRSILAGAVMAWARAMSEFGAVVMIAYYPQVVSTYIYGLFNSYGLERSASATSLLAVISLMVIALARITVKGGGAR